MSIAPADHASQADAALSHDARNSLAVLRLLVEGLRDGVVVARDTAGLLDQMMLHVHLLSDLLEAQLHSREMRCGAVLPQPVAIGSVLEQWSDAMRMKAEQRGVALRVLVAPSLPEVECRVTEIGRVLINLIDNAIRHSPVGGTVVVRAVAHPGGVQIQVNDSGPGLPRAERIALLEGSRLPAPPGGRNRLGLVIARTIVEAHGGTLWAGSPPRGASVRFYLPTTARAVVT